MDELTTVIEGIKYVKFHREVRSEHEVRQLDANIKVVEGIVVSVKAQGFFDPVGYVDILIPEEYALIFSKHS